MPRTLSLAIAALLCAVHILQPAQAADLFASSAGTGLQPKELVPPDTALGGYPMYQGGLQWHLQSQSQSNTDLRLKLGSASFVGTYNNVFLAQMFVMVNLNQANGFFTAEPCAKARLVRVNKGGGYYDNCLYIDPYAASTSKGNVTMLHVAIRNSQMGARIYELGLLLNLEPLGFAGSSMQDWSTEAVAADNAKKQLLDKVSAWGEQLQTAVGIAIGYDKPRDAFSAVPPLTALLPAKAASAVASQ